MEVATTCKLILLFVATQDGITFTIVVKASEAFKKATALEEEKVLQETEEMSQEIATLIEEAVSRGETRVAFPSHKKRLTKSIDNIGKILKKSGYFYKVNRAVVPGLSFQIDISWEPINPFEPQVR